MYPIKKQTEYLSCNSRVALLFKPRSFFALFTTLKRLEENPLGVFRPVLQILTLFQTKKCHFPRLLSDLASKIHTRFQTWPLSRNYVIIT